MKIAYIFSMLVCLPALAYGAPSPELAALRYADAAAAEDWLTAANQLRPSDLQRIRVAFDKQIQKKSGSKDLMKTYFDGASEFQVASLTDVQVCSKLMSRHIAVAKKQGWFGEDFKQTIPLGAVKDGDTTSYVVVKQKGVMNGTNVEGVNVVKTLFENDEWFVEVPHIFRILISSFER